MYNGSAVTVELEKLSDFCSALSSVNKKQAFAYGVNRYNEARCKIVTAAALHNVQGAKRQRTFARSLEYYQYRVGAPGILMLDYDAPDDGSEPVSKETLLSMLRWLRCDLIWAPSASSNIYHKDGRKLYKEKTSRELAGVTGQRVYIGVRDASDIPRLGKILYKRSWLAGYGRIELSKSGAMLERGLWDAAVFSPERLDFVSGADCRSGLTQKKITPEYYDGESELLNSSLVPDLTAEEERRYKRLVVLAQERAQPLALEHRNKWLDARVEETIARTGTSKTMARERLARSFDTGILEADFLLRLDDGKDVTVGDVLNDADRYNRRTLADPMEPEYGGSFGRLGRNKAVLYLESGRGILYSCAHGGKSYRLISDKIPRWARIRYAKQERINKLLHGGK